MHRNNPKKLIFFLFSVQSSAEKAAQDLFQMFEAVREDETNNNNKQPK